MSDKILERVRALMAKADGTNFPEEAEAFRAKADELMAKHAIEMWRVVEAQRGAEGTLKAEVREFERVWARGPYRDAIYSMFWDVARHCRCRPIYEKSVFKMPVVGMPSDLDYLDLLFTSLCLELMKRVDPKPLPTLGYMENIVMLKESGMSWPEIGRVMIKHDESLLDLGAGDEVKARNKMTRDYRAWCKRTGHPQSYRDHNVYRREFAAGFVSGADTAMARQRNEARRTNATGMELVVVGSKRAVDEAIEGAWPGLLDARRKAESKPVRYKRDTRKQDWAARDAGHKAGEEAGIVVNQNRRMANRKQISE